MAPLCPLLMKLRYSPLRSAIFSCHILSPKTCWSPWFALLTTCSPYLHIILQPTMVPWVHCRQLNNRIFWVQIWSKYNEARGNLKAARITATMNSQLWHMHLWWILWLVWYCPCLAHSYFWFDFGRAPGSNSLKCAAIASWKARIQKSNQKNSFFPCSFLISFFPNQKKRGKGVSVIFPDSFM